ncbi:IclR family transcriptional regulator [Dactylosporangium sp. CA-092794]|uniref:IclR family transcriptional regulator n=1 Tax=Dactylosporangium sp. CA-092794 TaxID=3239929 RepID=UPI003D8CC1A9
MTTAAEPMTGVRSARRALEIVSLLSDSRPVLTPRQVVELTGLPRTTVLRLVETLLQLGLLWENESGYIAGPALLRWAQLSKRAWELPATVREAMRSLAVATGETVSVYIRVDTHRMCIAAEEGTSGLRQVANLGVERPLWVGAPSRILLISTPPGDLQRIAQESPTGPALLDTLLRWRDQAERDGFAISHGEAEEGLSSLAVAARGPSGSVTAAISLAGPTSRFGDGRRPAMVSGLREVANRLEGAKFLHTPDSGPARH